MFARGKSFWSVLSLIVLVVSCGKDDNGRPITPVDETNCNQIRTNGIFNVIPNLDFESWSIPTGARFMDPDPHCFWATPNRGTVQIGSAVTVPQTVFRVSGDSAYSGNYAVMMKTAMGKYLGNDKVMTGTVTSGVFAVDISDPLNSMKFGQKFNKRPKTISGYYKFFSVEGDSCGIHCYVTKNIGGGKTDTLGWGRIITNVSQPAYTKFEFDLTYKSEETPDNIIFYFASSEEGDEFRGQPGNTLFIDNVKVDYHN